MKTISNGVAKFSVIFAVVILQTACGAEAISEQDRKTLSEGCQALKANEKRSACMEVVGRLGQAAKPPTPAASKPEQPPREAITLKGVPFETAGSSEAVMNLCLSPGGTYYTAEKLRKDDVWCKFNKNGQISMPGFVYGNLSDAVAHATVDSDGSLTHFDVSGSKGEMLELASLIAEKHGKPQVVDSQTENKLGTKFDKKTFTWIDQRGTRITIESIYDKIDSGRVSIDSAGRIKAIEAVQKIQKEVGKGQL
ncbi:MAG: hypothetical protein NTU86_05905 [Burkholderiales bacterium]|nr:hypothetical protein [Burkholderiales bacterium]